MLSSDTGNRTERIKAAEHDYQCSSCHSIPSPVPARRPSSTSGPCHCTTTAPGLAGVPSGSCHRGITVSIPLLRLVVCTVQIVARLHVWTGFVTVQSHAQVARDAAALLALRPNPIQTSSPFWVGECPGRTHSHETVFTLDHPLACGWGVERQIND